MVHPPLLSSDLAEDVQPQETKQISASNLKINGQFSSSTGEDVVPKEAVIRFRRGGAKSRSGCIVCK